MKIPRKIRNLIVSSQTQHVLGLKVSVHQMPLVNAIPMVSGMDMVFVRVSVVPATMMLMLMMMMVISLMMCLQCR